MTFGDNDAAESAEWRMSGKDATGSLVPRGPGGDLAGERSVDRIASSPRVSVDAIIGTLEARKAEQCCGRRVLAVQDGARGNRIIPRK
jgi:hypothetical protein